jgi:hypothetical protein
MTMDDRFLHSLREDPPGPFDTRLRARLRALDEEREARRERGWLGLWGRRLAPGLAVLAVIALVVFLPPLRASAQAFLDLFRVRKFVAVEVDPDRLEELDERELTMVKVLGEPEVVHEPGPPALVRDEAEAAARAGYPVAAPERPAADLVRDSIRVRDEAEARVVVDKGRVETVLREIGLTDARLPAALDGAEVGVRVPTAVEMHYSAGNKKVTFFQSPSPEISLPSDVDRAQLAELALRVAGLPQAEAHRIAGSVDLDGTVLLPLPAGATQFREVDVNGAPGLLIQTAKPSSSRRGYRRDGAVILWARDGYVYALAGTIRDLELLEMAHSIR